MLDATIQNVVNTATRCPGYVHPLMAIVPGIRYMYRPQCGLSFRKILSLFTYNAQKNLTFCLDCILQYKALCAFAN